MKQADLVAGQLYKLSGYHHGGIVRFTGECEHVSRGLGHRRPTLNARVEHYNGRVTLVQLNQLAREATSEKDVAWWTSSVAEFHRQQAERKRIDALSPAAFDAECIAADANVKLATDAMEAARDALREATEIQRALHDRRRRDEFAARKAAKS